MYKELRFGLLAWQFSLTKTYTILKKLIYDVLRLKIILKRNTNTHIHKSSTVITPVIPPTTTCCTSVWLGAMPSKLAISRLSFPLSIIMTRSVVIEKYFGVGKYLLVMTGHNRWLWIRVLDKKDHNSRAILKSIKDLGTDLRSPYQVEHGMDTKSQNQPQLFSIFWKRQQKMSRSKFGAAKQVRFLFSIELWGLSGNFLDLGPW